MPQCFIKLYSHSSSERTPQLQTLRQAALKQRYRGIRHAYFLCSKVAYYTRPQLWHDLATMDAYRRLFHLPSLIKCRGLANTKQLAEGQGYEQWLGRTNLTVYNHLASSSAYLVWKTLQYSFQIKTKTAMTPFLSRYLSHCNRVVITNVQ